MAGSNIVGVILAERGFAHGNPAYDYDADAANEAAEKYEVNYANCDWPYAIRHRKCESISARLEWANGFKSTPGVASFFVVFSDYCGA